MFIYMHSINRYYRWKIRQHHASKTWLGWVNNGLPYNLLTVAGTGTLGIASLGGFVNIERINVLDVTFHGMFDSDRPHD